VPLPPAKELGWGVKDRIEQGDGSEIPGIGIEKGLQSQEMGRIIAKTTRKLDLTL
jgi:hypothetical protein